MRKVKAALNLTVEELTQRVSERDAHARKMRDGPAKQAFIIETGALRTYLDMRLWLQSPGLQRSD